MSYHGKDGASTPIGKSVVLPKPGYSKSISPVPTTSRSSSIEFQPRKAKKRKGTTLSKKQKIQKIVHEIDSVRDAPVPIADISGIFAEPLFPRPHLIPPKDTDEIIDGDVEYIQVPELETTSNRQERDEEIIESGEDDEYKVLQPVRTYKAPGPRKWIKSIDSVGKSSYRTSGLPEYQFPKNSEAEMLWEELMKNEPQTKTIRNREIMRQIRKEAAERTAAANLEGSSETTRQTRRKRTKQPRRSSSPEMITMRGDFYEFSVVGDPDPFDPRSRAENS